MPDNAGKNLLRICHLRAADMLKDDLRQKEPVPCKRSRSCRIKEILAVARRLVINGEIVLGGAASRWSN